MSDTYPPCPKCGSELKRNEWQSTFTDKYLQCTRCDHAYEIKTGFGKAAQVAPMISAGGVLWSLAQSAKDYIKNHWEGTALDPNAEGQPHGLESNDPDDTEGHHGTETGDDEHWHHNDMHDDHHNSAHDIHHIDTTSLDDSIPDGMDASDHFHLGDDFGLDDIV